MATTLRRRRDEWMEAGVIDELRRFSLAAYDNFIGLRLEEVAVDSCTTKVPCGGEKAGSIQVDRGRRGIKRSVAANAEDIPLVTGTAPANRDDLPDRRSSQWSANILPPQFADCRVVF